MGESQDKSSIPSWVIRWLSSERLEPYLNACSSDLGSALRLYEWNIDPSQVLARDLAHFEVALRNAYDRVMCEQWGEGWLLDDESPVRAPVMRNRGGEQLDANRINRKIIDTAVKGLGPGGMHGGLVAELTLGFWVHLTDRSREAMIWRTYLWKAWPRGTRRAALQRSLNEILHMRNRVAHGERLFNPASMSLSPVLVDEDSLNLLRGLCPQAYDFLYGGDEETPVERFLQGRPAPSGIII